MPVLLLSPRYSQDSNALWQAAITMGWSVQPAHRRQTDFSLRDQTPLLYGEGLFAASVSEALQLALIQPTFSWLADLPERFRRRNVQCRTLGQARQHQSPAFIKPASDKSFPAQVYPSGDALPTA